MVGRMEARKEARKEARMEVLKAARMEVLKAAPMVGQTVVLKAALMGLTLLALILLFLLQNL